MLSRHAETIYWLARCMERAENTARMCDVTYRALLETNSIAGEPRISWEIPLEASQSFQSFREAGGSPEDEERVLDFLGYDARNPNSVFQCVEQARQSAIAIRDQVSSEMLEELNKLHRWMQEARRSGLLFEQPHTYFQEVKTHCHLFEGVTANTLLRDEGWHFHQAGRWLERGIWTARLLEVQGHILLEAGRSQEAIDQHLWHSLLRSVAAYEAYRRRYLAQITPRSVVEMLVLSPEFPRSVVACARYLVQATSAIAEATVGTVPSEPNRLARRVAGLLSTTLVEEAFAAGLADFLAGCRHQLEQVHEALRTTYFTD
jgi:uncharacterized alpha-E superfamily protein